MPAALVVCLLLALLAPAAPAGASGLGENGAIAFVGQRGGDRVVYVRKRGRTVGLLRGAALADAAWSPFGRRLAVTRELPDSGRAIWIFNADGTGERQLTASENAGSHASWAPGGRQLAYAAGPVGQRRIHVIGADGQRDRAITAGPEDQHSPVWGRKGVIAFVGVTPQGEDIYTVPARGGTPRRLTDKPGNDTDPTWDARGNRIAFVRGTGGIWVMSRFGNGARRIVNLPGGIEEGVSWSPDGSRLLFAGGPPGARQIHSVKLNGKGRRTLSLPTSNGEDPDWQSVGHDPVIAAAGDIACDPAGRSFNETFGTRRLCRMRTTSELLLRPDLAAVLPLGDLQYPTGSRDAFYASYGPTWGRLRSITRPVPGNHEFRDPGAAGYFDYFNGTGLPFGRAGSRARGGYYSYDVGEWHVVALNSNCPQVPGGGCEMGSAQQQWLARDLARHRNRCTLAYWHHPLFTSLASEEGRTPRETGALYQTIYDHGVDVLLTGHQHFYERLAPQDPTGTLDEVRGVRSFVVGTGGKSLDDADFRDSNSRLFDSTSYGILELELRPTTYAWTFRNAGPGFFYDAGSARCH